MAGSTENVVNAEVKVAASHLYGRSCTEIHNLNIQNVANVEVKVTAELH